MKGCVGVVILWGLAMGGHAFDDEANAQGKAFALSVHERQVVPAGNTITPESIPGFQAAGAAPMPLYASEHQLSEAADSRMKRDPAAQYLLHSRQQRPSLHIDRQKDPLFARHEAITGSAQRLSETYAGCVDLPVGLADVKRQVLRTCHETGQREQIDFVCQKTRHVSCGNSNAQQSRPFSLAEFQVSGQPVEVAFEKDILTLGNQNSPWRRAKCGDFTNTVRFQVTDLDEIPEFRLLTISYNDRAHLYVNDQRVFSGAGKTQRVDGSLVAGGRCDLRQPYQKYSVGIDLRPYLRVGVNQVRIDNQVGTSGGIYLQLLIRRRHGCDATDTYRYRCSAGEHENRGTLQHSVCSEGAAVRNGIFRSCWQWTEHFTRISDPVYRREATCDALLEAGCGQVSSRCELPGQDFCASRVLTFSCPESTAARTISLCGNDLVCEGGRCSEDLGRESTPATSDFTHAATSLAVAQEISRHLDQNTLTVFAGKERECERKSAGAADCCAESGWALNGKLAGCSAGERMLGHEKEAGKTTYIGRYSTGSFLEKRTFKVYCAFPSKIARVFIEQARAQLRLPWGSVARPDCRGLSLAQVQSLDFDAMNFSALHQDMLQAAKQAHLPSPEGTASAMATDLQKHATNGGSP